MSKNKRENLFFSHSDCTQEIPIQSSSFGRAKLYLTRVREKEMVFDTKQTFLKPALTLVRALAKSAVQRKERVKNETESAERERECATFATTTRRNCVAAWLALMVGA